MEGMKNVVFFFFFLAEGGGGGGGEGREGGGRLMTIYHCSVCIRVIFGKK